MRNTYSTRWCRLGPAFFALVVLCGLLVPGAVRDANAANYFNWGVESTTTSIGPLETPLWGDGTSQDCTVARSGNCSMKLVVRGDTLNYGMGAYIPPFYYNRPMLGSPSIYYRWWMRIMPGFKWGNGAAKTKSSRVSTEIVHDTILQGYTGYLMSYGFLIGECVDSSSPYSAGCTLNDGGDNGSDSNLVIPYNFRTKDDGVWHEYIVRVKPNTSATCTAPANCNAEFEAWVDGVRIGQYTGFKLINASNKLMIEGWGGWMIRPYFQLGGAATDGGTIYVDDFSTDDTFNSLITGGSIAAPTNLQVR